MIYICDTCGREADHDWLDRWTTHITKRCRCPTNLRGIEPLVQREPMFLIRDPPAPSSRFTTRHRRPRRYYARMRTV